MFGVIRPATKTLFRLPPTQGKVYIILERSGAIELKLHPADLKHLKKARLTAPLLRGALEAVRGSLESFLDGRPGESVRLLIGTERLSR